jgi:multidrug resistance efflux pump
LDTTETAKTIPTPLPLLMRRVRYQLVPVLTLVVSLALAGWLWVRRGGSVTAIGSVSAIQMQVNSKVDGLLVELPRKVQIFDSVSAGEVLARLDSSAIDGQIQKTTEQLNEVRRQLELINKMKPRTPTTAPTSGTGAASKGAPTDAAAAGATARAALTADATGTDANEALGNPLLQNKFSLEMMARNYESKISELEQRILAQDLKAPISGTIISIHRFPGQAVTAGQAIMTIASEKGDYIVTYVRQSQYIQPAAGMTVNVHLRSAPRTLRSHITSVGPQVEKVPPEHLRDPRMLEWGLPVHVAIPPDTKLRPGELVDLFFRPNETAGGT